jgi:Ca-activated chloride channel homolog
MKKSMVSSGRAASRLGRLVLSTVSLGFAAQGHAQDSFNVVHIDPPAKLTDSGVTPASLSSVLTHSDSKPIKKNVDLVMVPVTVTDERERIITGLEQGNFQVFDGKQKQEIKHFSSEDAPVSLGIVLDISSSMADKMDWARMAVLEFCKSANPSDEFFMVTFSDKPEIASTFTSHIEQIQNRLAFAAAKGRTAMLDAVYLALSQMRQAQYQKRALLIISDGADNHSRYTANEIKNTVKEADVAIYGIGIYDRGSTLPEEINGPILLDEITEITGGRAFTIPNPSLLPAVATQVGIELRNQYMLAYSPPTEARDGRWHKIKIKLSLPKSFIPVWIHAKTGYYAPTQ